MTLSTNATLSSSSHYKAGTWTITPSAANFSTGSSSNYTITYANATTGLTVAQQPLTITTPSGTLISGTDKVYNGIIADPIPGISLLSGSGFPLDQVSLVLGSANFADPNVGNNKPVTFSGYSISGADAADFALIQPTSSTANITYAPLTITAKPQTPTYGFGGTSAALGTTAFTISVGKLYGSDSVSSVTLSTNDATLSSSSNYNAGTWTITPSGYTGSGLDNYAITPVDGSLAS